MGPTASGKTGLAVALREKFPVDIISVDSALVYRGMDIGTAKPDAETLQRAPHALIDILDPAESYSAADFRQDALVEMSKITTAGRVPLLAGGTMLYFKALLGGLAPLPSADPEVRARIEEQAREAGWRVMHARLAVQDPEIAERIHYNDPQRIQRALEVIELTGKKMKLYGFNCEEYRVNKNEDVIIIWASNDKSGIIKEISRLSNKFDEIFKSSEAFKLKDCSLISFKIFNLMRLISHEKS